MPCDAPLSFTPVYKTVIWGGRRLARWRPDLPPGKIGEAWDLADHEGGMSVVASGPLSGVSLRELVGRFGADLVGRAFRGGSFPLMVKLIDAADRLSVQVHPDDALARSLGVGANGKTECWLVLEDGGELFVGARPGVHREAFERALAAGLVEDTLARFEPRAGDCFFLAARTVHALGAGCLVYELQQTLDVTFRVHDWGRVGTDGKPRALHLEEGLATIDFSRPAEGPRRPPWHDETPGVRRRILADGEHFRLEEVAIARGELTVPLPDTCAVVTCLAGSGRLRTPGGESELRASGTLLVPAAAGSFEVHSPSPLHLVIATPRLGRQEDSTTGIG
jgi:mannose-6-phosphate isomerase